MDYKVGDKVKIKTWEEMKEEFGTHLKTNMILCDYGFDEKRERVLNEYHSNRILTVEGIKTDSSNIVSYLIKERKERSKHGGWTNEMIKCLVKEPVPIKSRWELLDIR